MPELRTQQKIESSECSLPSAGQFTSWLALNTVWYGLVVYCHSFSLNREGLKVRVFRSFCGTLFPIFGLMAWSQVAWWSYLIHTAALKLLQRQACVGVPCFACALCFLNSDAFREVFGLSKAPRVHDFALIDVMKTVAMGTVQIATPSAIKSASSMSTFLVLCGRPNFISSPGRLLKHLHGIASLPVILWCILSYMFVLYIHIVYIYI